MRARFPVARGSIPRGPRPLIAVLAAPPAGSAPSSRARTLASAAAASASSPSPSDAPAPPLAQDAQDAQEAAEWEADRERYERFRKAFQAAQTMSQLYNIDRPPPVPLEEFEQRRLTRETTEVCAAAARLFGSSEEQTRDALAQLDSLVPGLLDLSAMTAREFALLASDVRGAAARVVALRVAWPRADVGRVLRKRPRMLLPPDAAAVLKRLARGGGGARAAPAAAASSGDGAEMAAASIVARDAESVRRALEGGADPESRRAVALAAERGGHASVAAAVDAVVEAAPELMDKAELSRALAFVRTAFPSSREHPAALLAQNPRLLLNLGESDMDDNADYGELTTRF